MLTGVGILFLLQREEERIHRVKVPSDYTKKKLEHVFTSVGWVLTKEQTNRSQRLWESFLEFITIVLKNWRPNSDIYSYVLNLNQINPKP